MVYYTQRRKSLGVDIGMLCMLCVLDGFVKISCVASILTHGIFIT